MAKNIKSLGIRRFLNEVYGTEGGVARLEQLLKLNWPHEQIAQEFGVRRQTIYNWEQMLKGEKEAERVGR